MEIIVHRGTLKVAVSRGFIENPIRVLFKRGSEGAPCCSYKTEASQWSEGVVIYFYERVCVHKLMKRPDYTLRHELYFMKK